jgi:hypothetical protein
LRRANEIRCSLGSICAVAAELPASFTARIVKEQTLGSRTTNSEKIVVQPRSSL